MSASRSHSAKEKPTTDTKKSLWKTSSTNAKDVGDIEKKPTEPSVEPELLPVSFISLFRFSTRLELLMDFIGLVAAAAAGAAQPLMTLLFGKLTQSFVNFQTVVNTIQSNSPDAQAAQEAFAEIAANFRHEASQDALYLAIIGVGMFVCTYTYMCIWVYTGEVNAKRVRENYLKSVLRQDIQFFDKVGAGEVTTRIQTDTHLVQSGISEKVPLVILSLSAFVTGFILAYIRSWRLALAMTSILPCVAIVGGCMDYFTSKYMQQSLKSVAGGGSLAEEVISAIRTTQAFGTQNTLASLYDKHVDKSEVVDGKAAICNGASFALFLFIVYSSYGLAFNFGTTLILEGHADAGSVVNVFMAILIGSFSLAGLAPDMQAITHGRGAAAKLYATIDRIPAIDSADPSGLKPDSVEGEITFEHVDFAYPARPAVTVVKGLSLAFRGGKTTAIVGASGSGKSTLVSLIERLYDPNPSSGVILLDGRDLRSLNLRWLRSQIGLVSQEPNLFATTIKGNVAHGLIGTKYEHASEEQKLGLIKEACVKSNADSFIMKLPLGYDTMVGERGFLLSGGQKQRVAIARAIVSDPRVLLLDEATSALDTQSEGIVQDALNKASYGRTTITIAHRLSTIKNADVIVVMEEGRVIEQGTHDELLCIEDGAYARLVQAQRLRDPAELTESADNRETPENTARAMEENPLGPKSTGRSLDRESEQSEREHSKYSVPYLFRRMGAINGADRKFYLLGTVCAILTGLIWPAYGIVYAQGINGFAMTGHAERVAGDRNALWFFLIAIISSFTMGVQTFTFTASAASLTAKLRRLTFRAILKQDIEFFDRDENNTGSLTSELSGNPQTVNGIAGITLGTIVQSVATLVGGTVVGLIFAWKLGLIGVACMPLLVTTGYIQLRVVVLKDQANKKEHAASAQLACEAAANIRTVAALTREEECCELYSKSLEGPLRKSNRTAILSNGLYAISQAMVFFVISLVFWYGARLVSRLEYSTFRFFVGLMSTTFSSIRAGEFFAYVPDVSSAKGAATDILKLLDSTPEIDAESTQGRRLDASRVCGQIRMANVHFRYPTRPGVVVLRDLNLQIEPGTYIALVGQSGCGKSTIIQMLERFYDPLAGEIYLDGENISDINVSDYRKSISLVSQEPTLYAGTVKFNILLGAIKPESEVTQEELEEACRKANILEFILSLPDGFETEVGGKGSQLSGGQKQRIAIARALLREPKVLLLDEATSALDSSSERVVQKALDRASEGRTTIAIAHRLSTIQNADRIYFIKEGAVSEAGTHSQLLSCKGDYYKLVQLQALSKKD